MKERQKLWKNLLEILNPPTKICKICFKEIRPKRITAIWSNNEILCEKCANLFHPRFRKSMFKGIPMTAVYKYDSAIRTYLYQFKGCYDYELYPVFLYRYAPFLHLIYHDYVIIPAPSYIEDDKKRGFNHIEMIYSILKLKMVKLFIKTEHHKQTECTKRERMEIYKYMKVKEDIDLKGKKVLLVDDVFTTGSTMLSMIKLLKKYHPKKIKILVLSKVLL